jgi:transcriptional regulator with XRE-family HTH domain
MDLIMTTSPHPLVRTIGRNIRTFRTSHPLTLKQLAAATGLSVSLLSQVERAESAPSIQSLASIANGLGIEAWELLQDFDDQELVLLAAMDDETAERLDVACERLDELESRLQEIDAGA